MEKGFVKYIVIIIVILGVVFLSQQAYARDILKNIPYYLNKYGGASLLGSFNNASSGSSTKNNTPAAATATNNSATNPTTENKGANSTNNTNSYKVTDSAYNSIGATPAKNINSTPAEKTGWTITNFPEKIATQVKSGGEAIANTVNTNVITENINNIKENISTTEKKVADYFSGITTSIIKPEAPQNCPAVTTPSN